MWEPVKIAPLLALTVLPLCLTPASSQPLNSFFEGARLLLFGKSHPAGQSPESQQPLEPMQVIGAGLPRTGTGSLHQALEILGYRTYHMMKVFEEGTHSTMWASVISDEDGTYSSPEKAFRFLAEHGYNASLDFPTSEFFELQMQMYPDAKVLLSIRDDPKSWSRSYRVLSDLVEITERPFSWSFPNPLPWLIPQKAADLHKIRCALGTGTLRLETCDFMLGRHQFRSDEEWLSWSEELYERHVEKVLAVVPSDRLLVFNVKWGWKPLCEFLGQPVPAGVPFPHIGESAFLRRAMICFQIIVYAWIPLVSVVAVWIWNRCRRQFFWKGATREQGNERKKHD